MKTQINFQFKVILFLSLSFSLSLSYSISLIPIMIGLECPSYQQPLGMRTY
mgnify:CR=1 FL=1